MIMKVLDIKSIKPLTDECFNKFRELIYKETGISMNDSKKLLVANRLRKRLIQNGLKSYEDYYDFITKNPGGKKEYTYFVNAISTNETYFFRGESHFKALKEVVLPDLFKKRDRIKIWSAGCSTGEEPYSIGIVLLEMKQKFKWNGQISIVATDLSTDVLKKAKQGVYAGRTLKYVSEDVGEKYFKHLPEGYFQVSNDVKKLITFKKHNLIKDSPPAGMFDIIFCRNVMIYFDKLTQKSIVDEVFAKVLNKDGFLFIGHSESLIGKSDKFKYAALLKAPIYILR